MQERFFKMHLESQVLSRKDPATRVKEKRGTKALAEPHPRVKNKVC